MTYLMEYNCIMYTLHHLEPHRNIYCGNTGGGGWLIDLVSEETGKKGPRAQPNRLF